MKKKTLVGWVRNGIENNHFSFSKDQLASLIIGRKRTDISDPGKKVRITIEEIE
ncbi:hypothetical protein LCGC14_1462190 [marine sediment metagenome]|uniref:Uncharacterized protein n=1 Tax=marine sediment metagenome TaxID=412755 RepID=A0A0F9JFE0_9ZZZZ